MICDVLHKKFELVLMTSKDLLNFVTSVAVKCEFISK